MTTFWPRLNTLMLLLLVIMAGAIITMLATRAYGGPLDPPGPVASTDGVRGPGTPISSLPLVISQPGNYYVTRPLTGGAGQSGITVSVGDVTIDLGGFTIGGAAFPGTGIVVVGTPRNITIRNGTVRAWNVGVDATACVLCRVEGVQASNNIDDGIRIGPGSEVNNCMASVNGGAGIVGNVAVVRNCTVMENMTSGIEVVDHSRVEDNHVYSNSGIGGIVIAGNYNTIRNNDLSGNTAGVDITVGDSATGSVLMSNVYCSLAVSGTHTVLIGDVKRVDFC